MRWRIIKNEVPTTTHLHDKQYLVELQIRDDDEDWDIPVADQEWDTIATIGVGLGWITSRDDDRTERGGWRTGSVYARMKDGDRAWDRWREVSRSNSGVDQVLMDGISYHWANELRGPEVQTLREQGGFTRNNLYEYMMYAYSPRNSSQEWSAEDRWVSDLPGCETCADDGGSYNNPHSCAWRFVGHPLCFEDGCEEPTNQFTYRVHAETQGQHFCDGHLEEWENCVTCGQLRHPSDVRDELPEGVAGMFDTAPDPEEIVNRNQDNLAIGRANVPFCVFCVENLEQRVQVGDYTCAMCETIEFPVLYSDRRYCGTCEVEYPDWRVMSYSHKPMPIFHPEVPDDPRVLYHGFEFEVANLPHGSATRWAEQEKLDPTLIYLKYDSSVSNGTEVVTHPFTLPWAKANFPFDSFQRAVDDYGASETHHSAGTHIHVSKASFSAVHLWKFLQIHFRLESFLQVLGGRGETGYASWQHGRLRQQAKDFAMKKRAADRGSRTAVNVNPQHTIELRYPASGFSAYLAAKNIELPNALYQFAAELSVKNVKEGVLDNPGCLQWWLLQEEQQFPNLVKYMTEHSPVATPFERSN